MGWRGTGRWGLQGNAGRDQAGSTCFGICTMGSRQKIDYGAETLIRCLSPLSLPQTEHPPRTTILHPLTSFPDHLINKISSPPHKALCTPSLLRLWARMMSFFFSPGRMIPKIPMFSLCSSANILPYLACNPLGRPWHEPSIHTSLHMFAWVNACNRQTGLIFILSIWPLQSLRKHVCQRIW